VQKRHFNCNKLLNSSRNHVVISRVHMQQNVHQMSGIRCLHCRKKTVIWTTQ